MDFEQKYPKDPGVNRVKAINVDWGVCICAIISGVVKLPLPLKTPARARTAKPSSVIT